jgi:hypothetical protein
MLAAYAVRVRSLENVVDVADTGFSWIGAFMRLCLMKAPI